LLPAEGERPTAYIIILLDTNIAKSTDCDRGGAAQTILLDGCIHGSAEKTKLRKPIDEIQLEPMSADGSFDYWRDEKGVNHVPKRTLEDTIIE
jgi:hypothetical protein